MDGSESSKTFEVLNVIVEIVPWSAQENDSNFEKVACGTIASKQEL